MTQRCLHDRRKKLERLVNGKGCYFGSYADQMARAGPRSKVAGSFLRLIVDPAEKVAKIVQCGRATFFHKPSPIGWPMIFRRTLRVK